LRILLQTMHGPERNGLPRHVVDAAQEDWLAIQQDLLTLPPLLCGKTDVVLQCVLVSFDLDGVELRMLGPP